MNGCIMPTEWVSNAHQGFMQDQFFASHTCFGGHMSDDC